MDSSPVAISQESPQSLQSISISLVADRIDKRPECKHPTSKGVTINGEEITKIQQDCKKFFSLIPNPFTEIDSPYVKKLANELSVENIMVIHNGNAFPVNGIDPFDILRHEIMHVDEAPEVVQIYMKELRKMYENINRKHYIKLVSHLFPKHKNFKCHMCRKMISRQIIEHITGKCHTSKMTSELLVYPMMSLAFWMHVLRIAEKDASWWSSMYKIQNTKKVKNEVIFRHALTSIRASFPPTSPLSVLSYHRNVPSSCKNVRLVTSFLERKLAPAGGVSTRLRCDEQIQSIMGTSVQCGVCPSTKDVMKKKKPIQLVHSSPIELSCPFELIAHLNNPDHLEAILAGQVDMDAIFFWLDAMARASDNKHEAKHPRSPLNRDLIAGVIDPISPYALLEHCDKVPHPCPDYGDAMAFLKKKIRKCDVVKFNEAMQSYFEETLLCGVCIEYDRIRSGRDFIAHITTSQHIENATSNGGLVSKMALRFWLDALCAAGAVVRSKDTNEVSKLFGDLSLAP